MIELATPAHPAEIDRQFAELVRYLNRTRQEAHTTRGQTLIVKPRRPKRSRLTGKWK